MVDYPRESGVRRTTLGLSPATIMQENATVFCGLLNAEEDYICVYVYVCVKFAHLG